MYFFYSFAMKEGEEEKRTSEKENRSPLEIYYLLRHTIERLVGMDSKELELNSTYEGQNGFIFKLGI